MESNDTANLTPLSDEWYIQVIGMSKEEFEQKVEQLDKENEEMKIERSNALVDDLFPENLYDDERREQLKEAARLQEEREQLWRDQELLDKERERIEKENENINKKLKSKTSNTIDIPNVPINININGNQSIERKQISIFGRIYYRIRDLLLSIIENAIVYGVCIFATGLLSYIILNPGAELPPPLDKFVDFVELIVQWIRQFIGRG